MINRPVVSRSIHFKPAWRILCGLALLLTLLLSVCTGAGAAGSIPARFTDVSPNALFGETDTNDSNPGGQIDALAIDPTNTVIVYAAGESSGVWKSTDGGHNWTTASRGLLWGGTRNSGLAVDASNPRRVLYAAEDDDLAANTTTTGGLYASQDGALNWSHISLPACSSPAVNAVTFSSGKAFVATSCGLAVSTDLSSWQIVQPSGSLIRRSVAYVAARAQTVYACAGQQVYRSLDLGATWTGAPTIPTLPGSCYGLAVSPDESTSFLAIYSVGGGFNVGLGRSATGTQTFSPLLADLPVKSGSGVPSVYAVPYSPTPTKTGPGYSYSVLAANGYGFYEYQPILGPENPARWLALNGLHADSHGLALPPAFSPSTKKCQVYAATDGGVFTNQPALNGCPDHQFVRAMNGLHAFGSFSIAGVPGPASCPGGVAPCPTLYAASNDNETWGTATGGQGSDAWIDMPCCGDTGKVFIDPAALTRVVTIRNGTFYLWTSSNTAAPIVGRNIGSQTDIAPPTPTVMTQVLTPSGQTAASAGDYLAIESPARSGKTGDDTIVRNLTASKSGWSSVGATFQPALAGDIQASNGHKDTYIYILAANDQPQYGSQQGSIWRGHVVSGQVASWTKISTGVNRAFSFWVDPFNPDVIYALDLGDPTTTSDDAIKVTTNATSANPTWQTDTALMQLATASGRYRMVCGPGDGQYPYYPKGGGINQGPTSYRYQCILNQIVFVPDHPELRFAVLDPAGIAVSHDGGQNWISIAWPADSPVDRPDAAFYDPTINPATGTPSLYVALHGHGVVRIDASFSTL
jgi:hypothetical protein